MRIERRLGIRSAYGQLVLIVFLPIAILAIVGGILVFYETQRIIRSEQDTLAQAALIRYEPMIVPLLPSLQSSDYHLLQQKIKTTGGNGMTNALQPERSASSLGRRYMTDQMYRVQSEQHIMRVAIMDDKGAVIVSAGYQKDAPWGSFDTSANGVWRLPTTVGTAYGMPIDTRIDGKMVRFWLFVDMDNEPLIIAYYRVLIALAITGLITILLLLLILNLYSKRWIAPVYEMRLFLQRLSTDNLSKLFLVKADGEFTLLQRELNAAILRLHTSFTELKKHSEETESDLQQAFDEMEMQNISIRQARDEALQASAAKSTFLANISHELRTPLNAIDGFINLLSRQDDLTAKQMLYVQTIKKSSAHLLALINDVLDFSKIEAGKITLVQDDFNLHDMLYEVVDMLSPTAFDKGLRTSVLIYNDVPMMMVGDKLRLKQVLTNLIANAVKFTDTGSVNVVVRLFDEMDDMLSIEIIDTGRGIDEHSAQKLFYSFSQGDLSITRRYGGTGLGLAISRELIELMGGQIGFFDNKDAVGEQNSAQGTTFWLRLPMTASEQHEPSVCLYQPMTLAVWISHKPAMYALDAYLSGQKVKLHKAESLAKLLEMLDNAVHEFDWVIADSFGQAGDLTALLRQLRTHHKGQLAIYGYQLGFDVALLAEYRAVSLYEPLERRALLAMLGNQDHRQDSCDFKGVQVLAVDDHLPNLLVLEAVLAEIGANTVQAESGFVALELIGRNLEVMGKTGFDIIFMDIQMPKMSGIETAIAIRNLLNHHKLYVPIVALSAHGLTALVDDKTDTATALQKMGFDEFATKPILQAELIRILQKFVSNGALSLASDEHSSPKVVKPSDDKPSDDKPNCDKPSDDSQSLVAIDMTLAIRRANHNQTLAKQLLAMMVDGAKQDKQQLYQHCQAIEDINHIHDIAKVNDIMAIAHKTLGASCYTGVPQIEYYARHLQNVAKDHLACLMATSDDLSNSYRLYQSMQDLMDAFDGLIEQYQLMYPS